MQCRLCNTMCINTMCIIPQQPPPPWRDISPTGSFCTGTSGRLFTVQRWRAVANTLSAEPSKVNLNTPINWLEQRTCTAWDHQIIFFLGQKRILATLLSGHTYSLSWQGKDVLSKHTVNVEYSPLGVDSLTHSLKPYSRLDKRNWQMTKPLATADWET